MSAPMANVTIYAKISDPLTSIVIAYMHQHSGCKVSTVYMDEDAKEEPGTAKYPHIHIGKKYFGGVECLGKFPLEVTEFRMMELDGRIDEPMTREDQEFDRLILFNGKNEHDYQDVFTLYKQELGAFWTVEEIDCQNDMEHWNALKPDERKFITLVLAFFASLDMLVCENISINFGSEIKVAQISSHFAAQDCVESIHAEAYALLIQTYIKDRKERDKVLRSVQTMPIIAQKAKWAMKYMDADRVSLAERLIGMVCLEGIQFSGSFASIYWLKSRGLMPGLCFANALIARDEGLHAEAGVLIYSKLQNKLPEVKIHEIFRSAIETEKQFICEALPVAVIGMNARDMSQYIDYIGNFWLQRLGYTPLCKAKNPFGWMEMIGLQGKSSFFEVRVSDYSKANVLADENETEFALDVDF